MRSKALGFTLVELMIVVAIVGSLSSIAMAAYSGYVRTSQVSVVNTHFVDAEDLVRFQFADVTTKVAMGVAASPPVPNDAAGWIAIIYAGEDSAPGGGPSYVSGTGDATTGAIGIDVSGAWSNGDSTVTITRPAFKGLGALTVQVSMNSSS